MELLVAEMQELKANPNRLAKGTIIEAELDKRQRSRCYGTSSNGSLKVDSVVAGTAYGRVQP